jgi:hypothetical protein
MLPQHLPEHTYDEERAIQLAKTPRTGRPADRRCTLALLKKTRQSVATASLGSAELQGALFPAPSSSTASPQRHRPPPTTMHLLRNGHPAHVFTTEDRRKAAAVTNQIRRQKRALFEQLRLNQELEEMLARDAARRQRRAAKQRRRREALTEQQKIDVWVERGYGRRL